MRFSITSWFVKVWHMPAHFHWMDPLPLFHRQGIILSSLLIVLCLVWPAANSTSSSARQPSQQGTLALDSSLSSTDHDKHETTSPPTSALHENAIDQQWRTYRVASGQTLAQLFRDNNLPPADVYAMAQVEGSDKPLSNLQAGQTIKIRENANGVVTGLLVESDKSNTQFRFIRQADGSFSLE